MKTVLITGVSSGIGLGITRELLKKGYYIIGSVRNKAKAIELKELLGNNFHPLIFDLSNHKEIDSVVDEVKGIVGSNYLSGIINNAGSAEIGPLLYVTVEDFRKQLDVLVVGQLYVIQKFYRLLLPPNPNNEPGRIVNISSVSGVNSNSFFGCYAAAKHALEGLSKTLREELNMFGIKVIVVAPGNIKTSIWDKQTNVLVNKYQNTEYYSSLTKTIDYINTKIRTNSMTIEQFANKFITLFEEINPSDRYTIMKKQLLFRKEKVIVLRN